MNTWLLKTLAALEQGIAVIAVKENRNPDVHPRRAGVNSRLRSAQRRRWDLGMVSFLFCLFFCNALRALGPRRCRGLTEAVGVMTALKAGVALSSVRRPLGGTVVVGECVGGEGARVKELENVDGVTGFREG